MISLIIDIMKASDVKSTECICKLQGRIEHPRPQINLGLIFGVWASLGLNVAALQYFCFTSSHF